MDILSILTLHFLLRLEVLVAEHIQKALPPSRTPDIPQSSSDIARHENRALAKDDWVYKTGVRILR